MENVKSEASKYLSQTAKESEAIREKFLKDHADHVVEGARMMAQCIADGGKVLIIGNGGSAADAQHMAAEMIGRMLIDRRPLPALALTTDSSNLTALGNDFGFDCVFQKQVEGLAREGDILIAISTSGNSKNVILAVKAARAMGCKVIGLTGGSGGQLKELCDLALVATLGKNSSRIQETHSFAIHSLVDLMDRYFLTK